MTATQLDFAEHQRVLYFVQNEQVTFRMSVFWGDMQKVFRHTESKPRPLWGNMHSSAYYEIHNVQSRA